ncbi:hypothetical protein ACH5RR_029742 [Cinchona calisaya]|uniref:Uncharacterized protein n=1 Tax=Cinchona calisaya TaxID=153742 RepID=A0ABD2YUU3_9GENT
MAAMDILLPAAIARQHNHIIGANQCSSVLIQTISAPISTVWSIVNRFDKPQAYKNFIKGSKIIVGDGNVVGSVRKVEVITGLPASNSTERLEILDNELHVLSFSIIGGDHRLSNYRSVTTLHPAATGNGTVVVESYVVDVPAGNTSGETCTFVDTIIRCNLQSLSRIAENFARNGPAKSQVILLVLELAACNIFCGAICSCTCIFSYVVGLLYYSSNWMLVFSSEICFSSNWMLVVPVWILPE